MIHCLSSNKKPPRQLRRRAVVVVTLSAARIATDDDDDRKKSSSTKSGTVEYRNSNFADFYDDIRLKFSILSHSTSHRSDKSDVENRDFLPTRHVFDAPVPSLEHCHDVWHQKTSMVWLFDGENFFEDMFIRFETVHKHDGQTDGHHATAEAALMHSIARQ